MALSEKALKAAYDALYFAGPWETWRNLESVKTEYTAFQAAYREELLEELREKVERSTCDSAGYVRRDIVLALLSPPPPEPKYKPGDWVVHEDGAIGLFLCYSRDARFGTFLLPNSKYARNGEWIHKLRPATPSEIARARGEEA